MNKLYLFTILAGTLLLTNLSFANDDKIKGRGAGYPWKLGDPMNLDAAKARCENDHPNGCEKVGAIWYPNCDEGYVAGGCCICKKAPVPVTPPVAGTPAPAPLKEVE